ncbi:MAG: protein kinase, partial [Polyangiaceae bacterium]
MKEPAPDIVIAGKYCLEGQLAAGGMGSVWVARHLDLEVPMAIKFMGTDVATSEEGRMRFEREAKAAAFLQSPHVVNVLDYGVDEGLAYIAMELLVGEDLEDRLYRVGRLSMEETLSILRQASRALRRAQDLGIVHRDLKPQNLYLSKVDEGEEVLKILDFGIAKETGPTLLAKGPNTGQIIGSPHYMSPEAVRGARDVDFRSDLWSLAVIVFQCVTGKLPFDSEIVGDVMGMILADPLPIATQIAPDLPPEIDDFFLKALARDRTQRFQSAREMADAFADVIGAPNSGYPGWPNSSASTPAPPLISDDLPRSSRPAPASGVSARGAERDGPGSQKVLVAGAGDPVSERGRDAVPPGDGPVSSGPRSVEGMRASLSGAPGADTMSILAAHPTRVTTADAVTAKHGKPLHEREEKKSRRGVLIAASVAVGLGLIGLVVLRPGALAVSEDPSGEAGQTGSASSAAGTADPASAAGSAAPETTASADAAGSAAPSSSASAAPSAEAGDPAGAGAQGKVGSPFK